MKSPQVREADGGLSVAFLEPGPVDLQVLAPYIAKVRELEITDATSVKGTRILTGGFNLRSLRVLRSANVDEIDLSSLPCLEELIVHHCFLSALAAPELKYASVTARSAAFGATTRGPIEVLGIEAEHVGSLTWLGRLDRLRQVSLISPNLVDVGEISRAEELQSLVIANASRLVGVDTLAQLTSIRRMALNSVGSVRNPRALLRLPIRYLEIDPNRAIGPLLSAELVERFSGAYITPRRARKRSNLAPATLPKLRDGVDINTFWPVIIAQSSGSFEVSVDLEFAQLHRSPPKPRLTDSIYKLAFASQSHKSADLVSEEIEDGELRIHVKTLEAAGAVSRALLSLLLAN